MQDLQDEADFQVRSASSTDSEIFTATANESANISQYGVEVVQLAQAHKLITTDGYADTDLMGAGTLTLTQNADSFSVVISATDTLTEVRMRLMRLLIIRVLQRLSLMLMVAKI